MRVDSRTETSMTRHHLQGGVRRHIWSASEPLTRTQNVVETKRRPTGKSDGDGSAHPGAEGRFVRRGENVAPQLHPQDPPGRRFSRGVGGMPQTRKSSCCGPRGVTSGPASLMNTLISLRMPNRPGRYTPGSTENPTPGTSGRSSAVSKLSM